MGMSEQEFVSQASPELLKLQFQIFKEGFDMVKGLIKEVVVELLKARIKSDFSAPQIDPRVEQLRAQGLSESMIAQLGYSTPLPQQNPTISIRSDGNGNSSSSNMGVILKALEKIETAERMIAEHSSSNNERVVEETTTLPESVEELKNKNEKVKLVDFDEYVNKTRNFNRKGIKYETKTKRALPLSPREKERLLFFLDLINEPEIIKRFVVERWDLVKKYERLIKEYSSEVRESDVNKLKKITTYDLKRHCLKLRPDLYGMLEHLNGWSLVMANLKRFYLLLDGIIDERKIKQGSDNQ